MISSIESLPWQALRLSSRDIPWTELRALALAAAESGDVRKKLVTEADRAIDDAVSNYHAKSYNYADFAVPAVFALAADKLNSEGKRDAAESLLHLLYRAGETDNDYVLDVTVAAAGLLGRDIVEPALDLFADHTWKTLDCWFHLTSLLKCAKDADERGQQRVIQFCRKHLRESPDRFERFSAVYPFAHVLAELNDVESLPLLRELFAVSDDGDLEEVITRLEGKPDPCTGYKELWETSVHEWLPREINTQLDWLEKKQNESDEDADESLDDDRDDDEEIDVSDLLLPPRNRRVAESNHSPYNGTTPIHRDRVKVGRNDPCPCSSGKKYKKCCGK